MEAHAPLDKPHLEAMFSLSSQFTAFFLARCTGQTINSANGLLKYELFIWVKVNQNVFLRRHMITHRITAWRQVVALPYLVWSFTLIRRCLVRWFYTTVLIVEDSSDFVCLLGNDLRYSKCLRASS